MGYKFAQVRYNQSNSSMSNTTAAAMISGLAFTNYTQIVQLGIQAPPGTKFYLEDSTNALMVGASGVFQLDLRETSTFSGLRFDEQSVHFVELNGSSYIIVDILYVGGGT